MSTHTTELDTAAQELLSASREVVARARAAGMDVAEAKAGSGWELTAKVRLGNPELLQEAGQRRLSLRVMQSQRVASTSTSDLSEAGLERLVRDAAELVQLTQPDEYAGPAPADLLCAAPHPDLDQWDSQIDSVDAAGALALATQAEAAAFACDTRLKLSEGATFRRIAGTQVMVLSSGFEGTGRGTYASLSVSPVAEDEGGKKRRGNYWTATRHLSDLEAPDAVGQEAARRTLRQLGARKVPTCEAAVVFDPDAGRSILGLFASCVLGSALWRRSSYLLGREGSVVASPLVTITDDPLVIRGPGSCAFDGEGLRSRPNVVVHEGRLESVLLDSYSARRLSKQSTASASRSGGSVGPSTTNFMLQPTRQSPAELIASTTRGLYVTQMMGFGFNPVTGDFSRGAEGFWIENGELTHAVSEVTISGNLERMLQGVDAVADDLRLRTSVAAPTFRIAKMTIGGT